jgi:hypothetical protein
LESQGGVCAICHRGETLIVKGTLARLAGDHDHTTGKLRGLLCSRCNLAIGRLEERVEVFEQAAAYLRGWQRVHAE